MPAEPDVVYFAHGSDSSPRSEKIIALARVARGRGFHVESPDYADLADPDERVQRLIGLHPAAAGRLVLAGSSMGAYVATVASAVIRPQGLFLMAPAFYRAGYAVQEPVPGAAKIALVHGWEDTLIPAATAIRFASQHHADLHILDSDHRLTSVLPALEILFDAFLASLPPQAG